MSIWWRLDEGAQISQQEIGHSQASGLTAEQVNTGRICIRIQIRPSVCEIRAERQLVRAADAVGAKVLATATHPQDDFGPRSAKPPFEIDPNPDGTIKDRGVGKQKPDHTFGADITTDVVVK